MKIGDFILNSTLLEEIEKNLSNLSGEELKKIKVMSLAVSLIADITYEMIESKSIADLNLKDDEFGQFIVAIISGAASVSAMRYASRTDNINNFLDYFKYKFEGNINLIRGHYERN